MTIDEARDMVLNAQTRLVQLRQQLHQIDDRVNETINVLDLLAKRLVPPEASADGGQP